MGKTLYKKRHPYGLTIGFKRCKHMKKLYILRHAKADYPAGVEDHERPLNKRGEQASIVTGKYLKLKGISPDYIISSDSCRTAQTIKNILREAGINTQVQYSKKLYLATAGEMLKELAKIDDKIASVLLVCHNPSAQQLATILAGNGNPQAIQNVKNKYPTCGLAYLELDTDSWKIIDPACGFLKEFVTPKSLSQITTNA